MPSTLVYNYFISHPKTPVEKDGPNWSTPLPMGRRRRRQKGAESVSYGTYFKSIRAFLEFKHFHHLIRAASPLLGRNIKPAEIQEISIYSEKHGEYYHPARIQVMVGATLLDFVLNVALSAAGKETIHREYQLLKSLGRQHGCSYLPRVYSFGESPAGACGLSLAMFLGQWWEGYHEFHLSRDAADQPPRMVVWDPRKGRVSLPMDVVREIYRQAAVILTCYYDVESFKQIHPWHHAAGDFVLCLQRSGIDLKLITVRDYISFTAGDTTLGAADRTAETILAAMLVFFLHLTLRMRLDRLDGVGGVAWSPDIAVEATLEGFFQGLSHKSGCAALPGDLAQCFFDYLSDHSQAALLALTGAIAQRYHPEAPETPVLKKHLQQHVSLLYHHINR